MPIVCMYMYMHSFRIYVTCVYVCMCVHVYVCMYVCVYMCMCVCMYIYVCTCVCSGSPPAVQLSGLSEGRHTLKITPVGCTSGSKAFSLTFTT